MTCRLRRNIGTVKPGAASGAGRRPPGVRPLVINEGVPRNNSTELSHDIRTQLYIIIGFVELMLEEIPGKINDEQRRNLNDVLKSGRRLSDLLQHIVKPSEDGKVL